MVTIAGSLGISLRQAYRDLHVAMEALAQVLTSAEFPVSAETPCTLAPRTETADLARMEQVAQQDVDVRQLVAEAVDTAALLAQGHSLEINAEFDATDAHTVANRVMLRQAVLNLLSHAVGSASHGPISTRLREEAGQAILEVHYWSAEQQAPGQPNSPYHIAGQLLQSLHFAWHREANADGSTMVRVTIPLSRARRLLIVDDNEGMIALLRRYLRHQPYEVYAASDPTEAVALLQRLRPDIVILDVMMPDRDGWELLGDIRASEAGRHARVVVCSIINDPELASALGADAFLSKPVDRTRLLEVLRAAEL
jgi:CheY-like chemotaxis protein